MIAMNKYEPSGLIIWDDKYNLGHKKIDYHHRNIIGTINEFYRTACQHDVQIIINSLISRIYVYTYQHFECEMSIMEKHKQDNLTNYIAYHKNIIFATLAMKNNVFNKDYQVEEIFAYLKDWWLYHITVYDRQFFCFLNNTKD